VRVKIAKYRNGAVDVAREYQGVTVTGCMYARFTQRPDGLRDGIVLAREVGVGLAGFDQEMKEGWTGC
jgi:hypothetical protein